MDKRTFKVVTLCGSTRFKDEFAKAQSDLTLDGYIVLSCSFFHHADGVELKEDVSVMLDEMHKQKIDMSSEIYVINKDGYIGTSTKSEIKYAKIKGKLIRYMF